MPPKQRKVPMRQCMGCGEVRPKRELVRVVRTPAGQVAIDFTGKLSGRGAYICPAATCLVEARKRGRLAKSLEVVIDQDTWQQLESACLQWQATGQAKR